MRSRPLLLTFGVYGLLACFCWLPADLRGQTPPKAMVLAWDGAVSDFVRQMLREKKLPNLAKLIEGGSFAEQVMPG